MLERWLGSSLDCSAPAPSVGSWVWKTVMRPPVEDMSLKAACSAGPRALWVSVLWLNMAGREVSRSLTSCRREERGRFKMTKASRKKGRVKGIAGVPPCFPSNSPSGCHETG